MFFTDTKPGNALVRATALLLHCVMRPCDCTVQPTIHLWQIRIKYPRPCVRALGKSLHHSKKRKWKDWRPHNIVETSKTKYPQAMKTAFFLFGLHVFNGLPCVKLWSLKTSTTRSTFSSPSTVSHLCLTAMRTTSSSRSLHASGTLRHHLQPESVCYLLSNI